MTPDTFQAFSGRLKLVAPWNIPYSDTAADRFHAASG